MKKWAIAVSVLLIGASLYANAQAPAPTTISALRTLTNAQASDHRHVILDATVTYYRSYENTLFVQDGNAAIYVQPRTSYDLAPGDRVRIEGTTHESFRPFVMADEITVINHGSLPKAVPASFEDLIRARLDCLLVTVRAQVLAANVTLSSNRRSTILQLRTTDGSIDAEIDSADDAAMVRLLDAEVEVTGAVSGRFDGKMQMTGVIIHVPNLDGVKVVKLPGADAWSQPVTPMDQIIGSYRVINLTQRVHVRGTVTYFMPGSAAVLQDGIRSLWVDTEAYDNVKVGDIADATGFPGVHDGFLTLTRGEIADTHTAAPVDPLPVNANELTQSHHVYDLVSVEARVVADIREAGQDEYVLVSNGHLFSAIIRHPVQSSQTPALAPMKEIPLNSTVRVTGVCILEDSNPFNAGVPFDLLLRSFDDIVVIARPSWLSVNNLIRLAAVLFIIVLGVSVWGTILNRKVRRQTAVLAARIAAEGALERRNAHIEQRRSRILEDINGNLPLADVLTEISNFVSFHLDGAPCWCEITDGGCFGAYQAHAMGRRMVREEIPSRTGTSLGVLCAALESDTNSSPDEKQAFFMASRLAVLAIETRRLYSDLVHRSEFDLLTDIHNRFSLEKHVDLLIGNAKVHADMFGLVFIDLDEFKQVNDLYGHRIGDLYLQEVALRMKRQLRAGDLLARIGGDEFATLVPAARCRADVEDIAGRLTLCFKEPFIIQGHTLHGSASIGIALFPEDGESRDSLLSTADAAMYVAKYTKKSSVEHG